VLRSERGDGRDEEAGSEEGIGLASSIVKAEVEATSEETEGPAVD